MSSEREYKVRSTSTSHNTSTSPSHQQTREMKLIIPSLRKASTSLSSPLPPPPPPAPCPWLWRCHSCYTIYRLAVTRRCLNCDHTFCLGDAAGAAATEPQGKKRKRGGPCKAEFDYAGWKARGAWRRTVLLNGGGSNDATGAATNQTSWGDEHEAAAREDPGEVSPFDAKRERLFLRKRHNCFVHCDFPSECHHSLFRAQQEGRPILREAEALDAAEEQDARKHEAGASGSEETRRWTRRLTMQEYKQRRAERRGKLVSAAAASRTDGDLSTVTEEEDYDYDGDESGGDGEVSPCSPTSPDPPGDLMREVSPIEVDGSSDEYPVAPSGNTSRRPSRASLLVTTDTPADFATTAAPLSFDDSCSDEEYEHYDDDDEEEDEEEQQRAKSRRKVAQLTGGGPPTALDLQAAWSEQAWFSSSSATPEPRSPKSPERVGTRDRMLALLGRRGSTSSSCPTQASVERKTLQQGQQQPYQPHADAAAVAGEEWESSSESSDSSSGSSGSSSGCSLLSSSSADGAAAAGLAPAMVVDGTDADGDVTMRDAGTSSAAKQGGEDINSAVAPTGAGGGASEDLRALLRMRNAFMRGDMM